MKIAPVDRCLICVIQLCTQDIIALTGVLGDYGIYYIIFGLSIIAIFALLLLIVQFINQCINIYKK